MFTLRDAFSWFDNGLMYGVGNELFCAVSTDTRTLPAGCLYVPIRGEHFDGHRFIADAYGGGALGVLFEPTEQGLAQAHAPAIQVPDTRRALGELARGWRKRFSATVVAVTGSNGKTTVKEMLSSIMAVAVGEPQRLATAGNLNNEIGVPQTLFRLRDTHQMAVIELGMNHPGEITWLAEMAQPDIALVNNAQREHQEFLDGVQATATENGAVFAHLQVDGVAVYPGDDACAPIWRALAGERRQITFGLDDGASAAGKFSVWATPQAQADSFELHVNGQRAEAKLNIDGLHNVRNALAATACADAAGIELADIIAGLAAFRPASGRMQRARSGSGATLIDDTYNANPDSVLAAIDVLADLPAPRILVLGDMGEVGKDGPAFHQEVGAYARAKGLQALLATGPMSLETVAAFGKGAVHFAEMDKLCTAVARLARPGASILVKGSRVMRMERAILALAEPHPDLPPVEAPNAA